MILNQHKIFFAYFTNCEKLFYHHLTVSYHIWHNFLHLMTSFPLIDDIITPKFEFIHLHQQSPLGSTMWGALTTYCIFQTIRHV